MTGAVPPRRGLRPLVALAVIALFVMLPALVAGARIDAPVQPAERARLVPPQGATRSIPAEVFYRATLPADPELRVTDAVVVQARLAPVTAIGAVALLVYGLLALGRARLTGLLACAALAVLPPVAVGGCLLRPEPAAWLAGLLGLLMLAAMAAADARPGTRLRTLVPFLVMASIAFGLAGAILPSAGIFLLVPLGGFCLAVLLLLTRIRRLFRRAPIEELPWRGWHRRHLPWLFAVVGALTATWLFQDRYVVGRVEDLLPTATPTPLLPDGWAAHAALTVLAALGALRLLVATGWQLSRRRRVSPAVLLLLFVMAQSARDLLQPAGRDLFGGAVAFAVLVAEGAGLLLAVGLGYLAVSARQS